MLACSFTKHESSKDVSARSVVHRVTEGWASILASRLIPMLA